MLICKKSERDRIKEKITTSNLSFLHHLVLKVYNKFTTIMQLKVIASKKSLSSNTYIFISISFNTITARIRVYFYISVCSYISYFGRIYLNCSGFSNIRL